MIDSPKFYPANILHYMVFTLLNVVATISHVLYFDAATIQRWPLIKGGVYCTEVSSVWILFSTV